VMLGQGLYPERHHGASRILPPAELGKQLDIIRQQVDRDLEALPPHEDFLCKYCPSLLTPGA
jgi:tryptophan 7-halogenase